MQQPPDMQTPPPTRSSSGGTAALIIGIVVALVIGAVLVVGVLASLGIFGMRKYLSSAKEAEGRSSVAAIARDVVRCSERETATELLEPGASPARELPPTTTPVPASLSDVSGRKYMSSSSDWTTPGWDCIKFSMTSPQYFQYQWVRNSPTDGVARAICDLDGDGAPDVTFEVPVTCTSSPELTCTSATMIKETRGSP